MVNLASFVGEEMIHAMIAVSDDRLAPVLFASSEEEATRFCALLEDVDIPALVGAHTGRAMKGLGVPILVPESLLERSSEILACADVFCSDQGLDEEDEDEDDFFPDDPDEDDELLDDDPDDD